MYSYRKYLKQIHLVTQSLSTSMAYVIVFLSTWFRCCWPSWWCWSSTCWWKLKLWVWFFHQQRNEKIVQKYLFKKIHLVTQSLLTNMAYFIVSCWHGYEVNCWPPWWCWSSTWRLKLCVWFFHQQRNEKIVQKVPFQKNSSRDTIPFNQHGIFHTFLFTWLLRCWSPPWWCWVRTSWWKVKLWVRFFYQQRKEKIVQKVPLQTNSSRDTIPFNQHGIFTLLLTSLVMLEQYLLVEAKTLRLIFSSTKKWKNCL